MESCNNVASLQIEYLDNILNIFKKVCSIIPIKVIFGDFQIKKVIDQCSYPTEDIAQSYKDLIAIIIQLRAILLSYTLIGSGSNHIQSHMSKLNCAQISCQLSSVKWLALHQKLQGFSNQSNFDLYLANIDSSLDQKFIPIVLHKYSEKIVNSHFSIEEINNSPYKLDLLLIIASLYGKSKQYDKAQIALQRMVPGMCLTPEALTGSVRQCKLKQFQQYAESLDMTQYHHTDTTTNAGPTSGKLSPQISSSPPQVNEPQAPIQYAFLRNSSHYWQTRNLSTSTNNNTNPHSSRKHSHFNLLQLSIQKQLINVDSARREEYLDNTEFEQILKMSRDKFKELPLWKQQAKKISVDLF